MPTGLKAGGLCRMSVENDNLRTMSYIKDAIRTESRPSLFLDQLSGDDVDVITLMRLTHAMMGITTEAGEFTDPIKKRLMYGKALDIPNLVEELGDLLWYIAIALDACNTTFEDVMARNINKLRVRYPDKFESDRALNRDLDAERATLE